MKKGITTTSSGRLKQAVKIAAAIALSLAFAGCGNKETAGRDTNEIRVVSLAPSITEIVCAVGGENMLAGRTSACDYPRSITEEVPVVGGFGKPSVEALLSVEPTLVLDADLADESIARKIEQMGFRRERVSCNSIADIPEAIRRVGRLIGRTDTAEELASTLEADLEQLHEDAASVTNRPRVYVEIWDDPLWTTGSKSHLSRMIYLAGGTNIGETVNKDHFQASHEWVVSKDPEVILCMYMSRDESAKEKVMNRPGWQVVDAIAKKNIYDGFDNNLILRPGPRIIQGIKELRDCINAAD